MNQFKNLHYTGEATTPEGYPIESIILAYEHAIPVEWQGDMGTAFGYTLTVQDLADVMAWMTSGRTAEEP